jgi:hypothetical protein
MVILKKEKRIPAMIIFVSQSPDKAFRRRGGWGY